MPARPPFSVPSGYDTKLSPLDEMAFKQWASDNRVPFNTLASLPQDYDMRGYYQGLMQGNPQARPTEVNVNDGKPHYTDYYKTPLHQSYSNASQWAPADGPTWVNDHQLAAQNGQVVYDEKPTSQSLWSLLKLSDLGNK